MLKQFLTTTLLAVILLFVFLSCEKNPTESDATVPEIVTAEVSSITRNSAECGGIITSDGGAAITSRGVCWSTDQFSTVSDDITTDGAGSGDFISSITGLSSETIYYVRAYASNSVGTGYGSSLPFTTKRVTLGGGLTVTDIDGNTYNTVTIGNQVWLVENLKVTHYRNGDEIPLGLSSSDAGQYRDYDNLLNNGRIYGHLYNWNAANDSRGLAPAGWHVPSKDEWQALIDYLGGQSVAGGKMKESGDDHWDDCDENVYYNESGFTALGAGAWYLSKFQQLKKWAVFWTSSEATNTSNAWAVMLNTPESAWINSFSRYFGFSVRCIKD